MIWGFILSTKKNCVRFYSLKKEKKFKNGQDLSQEEEEEVDGIRRI
jgi:hypothetical protein